MSDWDDTAALKRILDETTAELGQRLDADLSDKDVQALRTALVKVQQLTYRETIAAEDSRQRQAFRSALAHIRTQVPEGVEIPELTPQTWLGDKIGGPGPGPVPDLWADLYGEGGEDARES
jgi:hypothetical protein